MPHLLQINNSYLAPLTMGDTIDIIAPASGCHPEVATKLKQVIESWGLQCRTSENLFGKDLLCANSDEQRFLQLTDALTNKTSKAVWCLLGGYGSSRLIPHLNNLTPLTQKKFFIGFSDITALHIFFQKWNWTTIHGPSGRQTALKKVADESITILKELLFQSKNTLSYEQLHALNKTAKNSQLIEAEIIGGNLSLIQASLATNWQIDTHNKILFIEEINERGYKIDRMLEHIKQAKILQHVKAILFGDCIGGEEVDGKSLVADVIRRFSDHCDIPAFQIENVGHGTINHPIILGSQSKILLK